MNTRPAKPPVMSIAARTHWRLESRPISWVLDWQFRPRLTSNTSRYGVSIPEGEEMFSFFVKSKSPHDPSWKPLEPAVILMNDSVTSQSRPRWTDGTAKEVLAWSECFSPESRHCSMTIVLHGILDYNCHCSRHRFPILAAHRMSRRTAVRSTRFSTRGIWCFVDFLSFLYNVFLPSRFAFAQRFRAAAAMRARASGLIPRCCLAPPGATGSDSAG